jgi:hypothetical protein
MLLNLILLAFQLLHCGVLSHPYFPSKFSTKEHVANASVGAQHQWLREEGEGTFSDSKQALHHGCIEQIDGMKGAFFLLTQS